MACDRAFAGRSGRSFRWHASANTGRRQRNELRRRGPPDADRRSIADTDRLLPQPDHRHRTGSTRSLVGAAHQLAAIGARVAPAAGFSGYDGSANQGGADSSGRTDRQMSGQPARQLERGEFRLKRVGYFSLAPLAAAHARQIQREPDTFWLSRHRKGPGMQYVNSIFGELLKPIDRRQFREIVERHNGNAYDKTFKSWDHLVTMVGAQLGGVASLRAVEATFKANSHQHYHLGVSYVPRSTLSRANARRPVGVFAETFAMLAKKADRHTRAEGAEMVRLIDSSPVPLGKMCEWAEWNGRIRGLKMHVVYHPGRDVPRCVEITPATVNDVEIGRQTELDAGATYVFDKGYYHFGWWKKINAANAFFVTRVKVNTRLRKTKSRYVRKKIGDGFRIIADADVVLASKGDSKLAIPLRRIKVKRDMGGTITLITNDLERTAVEIAALYKGRWQIELLFRWIKQHLNLSKFMGKNDNAIRLQIIAAMIAYLLLRLARRLNSLRMLDLRLAELVCQRLFTRIPIAEIDTPPPVNPSKPKPKFSPDQLGFNYV